MSAAIDTDVAGGLVRAVGSFCEAMAHSGAFRDRKGGTLSPSLLSDGLRYGAMKMRIAVTLSMQPDGTHHADVVVEAQGDGEPLKLLALHCVMGDELRVN